MPNSVFQAIVPKNPFAPEKMWRELNKALDTTEEEILKEFGKSVQTWTKKPKFKTYEKGIFPEKFTEGVALEIGTSDKIYGYVSEGTEAHVIRARNAPALRFTVGGKSKTTVGRIPSRKGARGTKWVVAQQVQHPGNQGREFEKRIEKKLGPKFRRRIRQAVKAGLK